MTVSSTTPDEILTALALHYGLLDLGQLTGVRDAEGRAPVAQLVAAGLLSAADVAFLERKAGQRAVEAGGDFLALIDKLGYLPAGAAARLADKLRAQGVDRDYEAACLFHRQGLLPLHKVIDVLESLGRPLVYCGGCQVGYYPQAEQPLDESVDCPTCQRGLQLLTRIPGGAAAHQPLPWIERLAAVRLDPRVLARQAGLFTIQLAYHYRLISAEQAELVAGIRPGSIEEAAQLLFEEGYLTTVAFRFLLSRAEEVQAAGGQAALGSHDGRQALAVAEELGYLSKEDQADFIDATQLNVRLGSDVAARHPRRRESSVVQLLYNRGYVELYQAVDLLEKCGILLDHCGACDCQVLSEEQTVGECPACHVPMRRVTGWEGSRGMARPIPAISRLVIRQGLLEEAPPEPSAESDPTQDFDASLRIVVADLVVGAPTKEFPDEEVVKEIKRYRLLNKTQGSELVGIRQQTGAPMFRILEEFGFFSAPELAFLKRRLDPGDGPDGEGGPLALALERGYLPAGARKHLQDDPDTYQQVSLLARAYNSRHLKLYQLADVLDSRAVWLEHCPKCELQIYFEPGSDIGQARSCLKCGGGMEALARPDGQLPDILPRPSRMRIARVRPLAEGQQAEQDVEVSTTTEREEVPTGQQLVEALVLRYGLLEPRQLERAVRAFDKGPDQDLGLFLFQKGLLTPSEVGFLNAKQAQVSGGRMTAGELHGHSVIEVAQSKGYLDADKLVKLFTLPGAPDRHAADDLQVGLFIHVRGGLTLYQWIDVLEEQGTFLAACESCSRQFHIVGDCPAETELGCPDCGKLLVPLTYPPGWRARFDRLPSLDSLSIRRVDVSSLPVIGEAPAPTAPATEAKAAAPAAATAATTQDEDPDFDASMLDMSFVGLSMPLVELQLDEPTGEPRRGPKREWGEGATKEAAAGLESLKEQAESSRMISAAEIQKFYQDAFPNRRLQTAASKLGAASAAALERQVAPGAVPRRVARTEEMVESGIQKLLYGVIACLGLIVVGLSVGLVMVWKGKQPVKPKVVKGDQPSATGARAGKKVKLWGRVDPDQISTEDGWVLIALDVDRHYWVLCDSQAARKQLALLNNLVRGNRDKQVLIEVDGSLQQAGADMELKTPAGRAAYYVLCAKMRKVNQLPGVRINLSD